MVLVVMRRWSTTRGTMTKVLSMVGITSHWSAGLGFDPMLGLFHIMPAYRQRKKNNFYYIFWGIISPYYLLGIFICLDYETVLPFFLCGSIGYGVSRRGLSSFLQASRRFRSASLCARSAEDLRDAISGPPHQNSFESQKFNQPSSLSMF